MATIQVNPSSYFECSVCMEDIDDSWKMLPCQHVFCLACLRRLYDQNQHPECPTCREQILVSLESLQKPRFLYEMFENMTVRTRNRQGPASDDIENELIAAVEQQSIDDFRQEQEEIVREDEHLQIALCKSAEEAAQKEEMESLLNVMEADLIAAIELSIRENATSNAYNREGNRAVDGRESAQNSEGANHTNVPVSVGLSDFNDYLKSNGNVVLNTILTVVSHEEELNSLESTEIIAYLKAIDRYLNTLKNFHRQQIDKIIVEFGGEVGKRLTRTLTSENRDNDDDEESTTSCNNNKGVDLIADLVKALEQEKNDDAVLKVALKKSEVLDPIDTFQKQFVGIKKKLENVLLNVVIKSESRSQAATPPHSTSTLSQPVSVAYSPSLILPIASPAIYSRFVSSPTSHPTVQRFSFSDVRTRGLILPLASNSSRYSSFPSNLTNYRGRNNINLSSQRARNNYRGSARGDRGGSLIKNANVFNGNRDGYNEGRDRFGSTNNRGRGRFGSSNNEGRGRFGSTNNEGRGRFGSSNNEGRDRFGSTNNRGRDRFGSSNNEGRDRFGSSNNEGRGRFGSSNNEGRGRFGSSNTEGRGRFGSSNNRGHSRVRGSRGGFL